MTFFPIATGYQKFISWMTALWPMSVGVLLGMVTLLLLWVVLLVVNRKAAREVPLVIGEGVLMPITFIVGLISLFALAGVLFVRGPVSYLDSITRLHKAGSRTVKVEVPAGTEESPTVVPIEVAFRGDELRQLEISANTYVQVSEAETQEVSVGPPLEIGEEEPYKWTKPNENVVAFGGLFIKNFYVTNATGLDGEVTITIASAPVHPQVIDVPIAAVSVIVLFLLYFIQAWFFPRVSAIALATTKSEIAQPIFFVILMLGIFLILLFQFLPYHTFGEDIKMLKDQGLTLIMVLAIIQGVWAASNSIAEEIEGRTALTVLSKPIGRRQFIFGKLLGILWTVGLLFICLGVLLLMIVAYKVIYDSREMGAEPPVWQFIHQEVVRTVPGLLLGFFETVVLVSLSVAISTRLPMLANFVICFSIYVLGHLTPLIVQAPIDFAPVVFIGNLIATILPVLDHFNVQAAVAAGKPVPLEYLLMAFVYCVLYSSIALLLALALFEDRDLA